MKVLLSSLIIIGVVNITINNGSNCIESVSKACNANNSNITNNNKNFID